MTDTKAYQMRSMTINFIDHHVVDRGLIDALLSIANHYSEQNKISCSFGHMDADSQKKTSSSFDGTDIRFLLGVNALPKDAAHKYIQVNAVGPHSYDILHEFAIQFEIRKFEIHSKDLQESLSAPNASEVAHQRSQTAVAVRASKNKKVYKITDPLGLHIRPSAELFKIAEAFKGRADIVFSCGETSAEGLQIMEIMLLDAKPGKVFTVEVSGKDRDAAMLCIHAYLTTGDSPYIQPDQKIDLCRRAVLLDASAEPQAARPAASLNLPEKRDQPLHKAAIGNFSSKGASLRLPDPSSKEGFSAG